ncbi:uncharacterized protein LOC557251 [Danio rerio]|uniref:Si:ch211-199m3.1 n=1 Tax=Danio rerio TaxID=7955 RepID=Q5RH74_DANRE|nr:uncharacterized protein LOC557251 [Danio rerio]|eukprot:NP_001038287.1 uncharacterized protein LOC557251 [Danio rerio]
MMVEQISDLPTTSAAKMEENEVPEPCKISKSQKQVKQLKERPRNGINNEKEKVKEKRKKRKKSKVASFIRAALRWFCFCPRNEPFTLSSSDGK